MAFDFYHQQNKKEYGNVQKTDPYAEGSKNAMINMVPEWLRNRMKSEAVMHYMSLSEEDLEEEVVPNLTLKRLRTSFWREYELLHRNYGNSPQGEKNLSIYRICVGICTNDYFADKIAPNDLYLSWIIRPPVNYEIALEESLQHGLNRMREILNFSLYKKKYNKDGVPVCDKLTGRQAVEPDEKIANMVLKTVAFLDLRVKGAIPQKIQQYTEQKVTRQSVNYNVKPGANDVVTVDVDRLDNKLMTIDDLDSKIAKLSKETQDLIDSPRYSKVEKKIMDQDVEAGMIEHAEVLSEPK